DGGVPAPALPRRAPALAALALGGPAGRRRRGPGPPAAAPPERTTARRASAAGPEPGGGRRARPGRARAVVADRPLRAGVLPACRSVDDHQVPPLSWCRAVAAQVVDVRSRADRRLVSL